MRIQALLTACAIALGLLPTGALAQDEPTAVCTELAASAGSVFYGNPALRGAPADGECDIVVYLPLVLADSGVLQSLIQEAELTSDEAQLTSDLTTITLLAQKVDDGIFSCETHHSVQRGVMERNLVSRGDPNFLKVTLYVLENCY